MRHGDNPDYLTKGVTSINCANIIIFICYCSGASGNERCKGLKEQLLAPRGSGDDR
jgi:hypothetical protein